MGGDVVGRLLRGRALGLDLRREHRRGDVRFGEAAGELLPLVARARVLSRAQSRLARGGGGGGESGGRGAGRRGGHHVSAGGAGGGGGRALPPRPAVMLRASPGKRAREPRLARQPRIFRSINALRARFDKPPLIL